MTMIPLYRAEAILNNANTIYWNLALDMWEMERSGRCSDAGIGDCLYRSFIVQLCVLDLVDRSYKLSL